MQSGWTRSAGSYGSENGGRNVSMTQGRCDNLKVSARGNPIVIIPPDSFLGEGWIQEKRGTPVQVRDDGTE
jgi:hypothetical protein